MTISPLAFSSWAIKLFLCLIVAWAWKSFVPASPSFTHLILLLYFQYIFYRSSNSFNFSINRFLKFHSRTVRSLCSSMASSTERTFLTFSRFFLILESFWL
jgi:hypothetical protein